MTPVPTREGEITVRATIGLDGKRPVNYTMFAVPKASIVGGSSTELVLLATKEGESLSHFVYVDQREVDYIRWFFIAPVDDRRTRYFQGAAAQRIIEAFGIQQVKP